MIVTIFLFLTYFVPPNPSSRAGVECISIEMVGDVNAFIFRIHE